MTDDIKEYKKRNVLTNRLNAVIHNRNLFVVFAHLPS